MRNILILQRLPNSPHESERTKFKVWIAYVLLHLVMKDCKWKEIPPGELFDHSCWLLFRGCQTLDNIYWLTSSLYCFFSVYLPDITMVANAFGQVFMTASVFMVVALTYERHFAICSPHRYRIHIRTTPWWKHLAFYVVPVTVASILFNIPSFLNIEVSPSAPIKDTRHIYQGIFRKPLDRPFFFGNTCAIFSA